MSLLLLVLALASSPAIEESVEVRAAAPTEEDVAAFATRIETDDAAERADDLAELLRRVPGARVRSYGGLGRFATVSLRGSTAEQVTIMLDGVPLNSALGGAVDLSTIPVTAIESITVYRGFAPASAGLNGLGGLVDIRTRRTGDTPTWRADALHGSLDTTRVSLAGKQPLSTRTSLGLGAELFTSEGDFDYYGDLTRGNNDVEALSLDATLRVDEVFGGTFALQARHRDREQGVPGLDLFTSENARLDEEDTSAQLSWTRGGFDLIADLFERESRFLDREGELGVGVQDETTRLSGGGIAALVRRRVGDHSFLARADLRRERARVDNAALGALSDRGGVERTRASLVVEDTWRIGRLTLAPALRIETRDDDFLPGGADLVPPPAEDLDESETGGKLGLAWQIDERWSLRASAGRFHRIPSLLELFGDRGSVRGNPALRTETADKAELGARFESRHIRAELVVFHNEVEDLILFQPNSQSTAVARNLGAARIRGAEASLRLDGWRGFALSASGTLQDARETIVGFPERLGEVAVEWRRASFDAGWQVSYVGENFASPRALPGSRLPSRVSHDLRAGWSHSSGWRFGVEVVNLFDRESVDVIRYPLPGRLVYATIGWSSERRRP